MRARAGLLEEERSCFTVDASTQAVKVAVSIDIQDREKDLKVVRVTGGRGAPNRNEVGIVEHLEAEAPARIGGVYKCGSNSSGGRFTAEGISQSGFIKGRCQ